MGVTTVVRGLDWKLEGKEVEGKIMVKIKKKGENYHDRHAVLYLGFILTVLVGRHKASVHQVIIALLSPKASNRSVGLILSDGRRAGWYLVGAMPSVGPRSIGLICH